MDTAELKSKIQLLINQTDDRALLLAIYEYLLMTNSAETSSIQISSEERKAIEHGLNDIEAGRVVSHERVMKNARNRIDEFKRKE